ncbi:hypothetical protein [Parahaliea aestuarii]|uniref:Uncharacterized protein n=1 Tax=Parahaliea aestuarii TaxID=1852021 RepID=A0A5C8ZQF7_9GAMM|nr:hypothetical protein [Parahaliea aestuarii]TXS89969.1 hypothetical protein FVW59_15260 [Parahaliea aestuarii]
MKRRDQGKASLVDILRSIKFSRESSSRNTDDCSTHFADFEQRARTRRQYSAEDAQLIRSAN